MSTNFRWRIGVQASDGTHKATLEADSSVVSINNFSITPVGGCLEGSFTVIPSQVNVKARDIVTFQVSNDNWQTLTSVYRGVVVLVGDERSNEPAEVRTVGLHKRLFEAVMPLSRVEGGDVAAMVFSVMNYMVTNGLMPEGITHYDGRGSTGFQLGARFTNLETVGEFLDAMAQAAGPFIVPPGETYSYDGRVWAAGETVPGCRWGVNASGGLMFYRPVAAAHSVVETDRRTHIEWGGVAAEEAVNNPVLVYASQYTEEYERWWVGTSHPDYNPPQTSILTAQTQPIPLARSLGSGRALGVGERVSRVVSVSNPVDYMTRATLATYSTPVGWTDWSNAFDGNPSTYAVSTGAYQGTFYASVPVSPSPGALTALEGILRLRYSGGGSINASAYWSHSNLSVVYYQAVIRLPADSSRIEVVLPVLRNATFEPAGGPTILRLGITFWGSAAGVRLYEAEFFVPDVDAGGLVSEALANSLERPIAPVVSNVTYHGLGPLASSLNVSPAQGAYLPGVPVEQVSYSMTVGEGVVTRYLVGQAFDGALTVQRAVLESLSQQATGETRWRSRA